ncbi:ABC transporter permease [Paenarthrobacter histidinolovorans]|uniref:ABC transporter permease n=1 Tax=Paenarthrobacter histidinolovorans TaxID=43664 RepID=UPI00166AB7F4|nr:ABC transporter permease [Paenarthrobacter histidinolovorans]
MGGSWDAPLGTDQLGRDVLLQLSLAIRISALVATVSVLLAGTIGVMLGLVSGYRGGWMDSIVNRLSETQMALPFLVVAMVLAVALGPSLTTIVVAIALSGWVPFARLVRAEALVLRNREFVLLAKVASVSSARIVLRHLLPNVLPSVVVLGTQSIAIAVLEESALSFLGLGVQPPMMSLGSMIGQTRLQLQTDAWLPLTPIIVLALLALAINILGDRFRRRLEIKK